VLRWGQGLHPFPRTITGNYSLVVPAARVMPTHHAAVELLADHERRRSPVARRRAGPLLDTFTFSDPSRTLDLNPTEVDRLRATTERVIAGKADVHELLRSRLVR